MNSKQNSNNKSPKYDVAYINPGFNNIIEAMARLNNRQKVLLVFENELIRNDRFQLTQTFPLHLIDLPKTVKNSRLWQELFLLSPHLIQPQKVIYSHSKGVSTVAKIIDLFFQNTFNTKSISLNKQTPKNLSFLKTEDLNGIIFQEYKVNVSRFLIELIKYFELNGGKIVIKESLVSEEISTVIHCKIENKRSFIVALETPSNIAWVNKIGNTIFHFTEKENKLQVDTIRAAKRTPSKKQVLSELSKVVTFNSSQVEEIELPLFLSAKTVANILKTFHKSLPGSFLNATLQDNYELSLEKFDIAKQTGITYPQFKILFHRYGTGIDEMIDEAYEKMNKTRDAKKIWKEVEEWFQKKYEWKT